MAFYRVNVRGYLHGEIPSDAANLVSGLSLILSGEELPILLKKAVQNEPVKLTGNREIGKRQNFENIILSSLSLCSLMYLAALTFPHETWTRYPNNLKRRDELDCDSYTENLGIVSCLREIGQLTKYTLSDVDLLLEMISTFFAIYKFNPEQK